MTLSDRLSELKRRLVGPEQTPLNPGGIPGQPGEVSTFNERPRRSKLMGVGVLLVAALVIFTAMRSSNSAPSAAAATAVKRDVHTSEPTTTESLLRAMKNAGLPNPLGAPAEVSDGDKERERLALADWERKNSAPSGTYGQSGATTTSTYGAASAEATAGKQEDPIIQEERKQRLQQKQHEYSSLFANPAFAVGSGSAETSASGKPPADEPAKATSDEPSEKEGETFRPNLDQRGKSDNTDCISRAGEDNETRYCLPQGTPIPVRLTMRAIGDLPGPVKAMVASDVYYRDRQHMLIPGGTELIGRAHALGSTWQERLSISFDRMLLPDGRSVPLKDGLGLDQYGSMGVKDHVNRHLTGKIMTVLSLGAFSALAGAGTNAGYNQGYGDVYRQSVSQQAAQVGQQMIGRQLNRPNSLTIDEGKVMNIWLSEDVYLQEWRPQ